MTRFDAPAGGAAEPATPPILADAPWRRVVAVGDSIAEGVREAVPGWPDRSWVDHVVAALPGAEALNLGRRNLLAREVRAQQLEPALAFGPDLAIVSAGGNDSLRPSFDPAAVGAELDAIVGPLRDTGADVLMIELLDIVRSGLVPEAYAPMARALADMTREVAARHGALLVEMRGHPVAADPGVYASDRLHLNTRGHAIVGAEAVRVLAAALAAPRPA